MKTKTARLNQIIAATFLFVFLMSGNVEAEGKEWNAVSELENVTEPRLEVENWMVNENFWYTQENTFVVEPARDENLAIEPWMFDRDKWGMETFDYALTAPEKELMLESWMTDDMFWN